MSALVRTREDGTRVVALDPNKRVLFLTKDLELIKKQLAGELTLSMADVDPADLLDDINTDAMTPAWVCFRHRPEDLALDAYAGIVDGAGERVFPTRALLDGNFQAGFRIHLHRKDLRLALEAGREQAVPLPATANVAELMNAMIAQGLGDLDHSGLAALYAKLAGLDGP